MKNRIQIIALGLLMCSTFYANAQSSNTPMYAELKLVDDATLTTSEKIVREVDNIVKLTEDLIDADENQEKKIKTKIAARQAKIRNLKDKLEGQSDVSKSHKESLNFVKHDFDISENSLQLEKFKVKRNGDHDSFELNLETNNSGKARIDVISPGGELLEAIVASDYNGKLNKEIDLNTEPGKIYFLNITVGDKATTKKVVFK